MSNTYVETRAIAVAQAQVMVMTMFGVGVGEGDAFCIEALPDIRIQFGISIDVGIASCEIAICEIANRAVCKH